MSIKRKLLFSLAGLVASGVVYRASRKMKRLDDIKEKMKSVAVEWVHKGKELLHPAKGKPESIPE